MFKITLDEKNDCKWEVSRNRHIAKYLVVAMESPPSIGDLISNAKLHCDVVTTFAKIAEYAVTTWSSHFQSFLIRYFSKPPNSLLKFGAFAPLYFFRALSNTFDHGLYVFNWFGFRFHSSLYESIHWCIEKWHNGGWMSTLIYSRSHTSAKISKLTSNDCERCVMVKNAAVVLITAEWNLCANFRCKWAKK